MATKKCKMYSARVRPGGTKRQAEAVFRKLDFLFRFD